MCETTTSSVSSTSSSSSRSDSISKTYILEPYEIKNILSNKFNIKNLSKQTIIEKMTEIIEDSVEHKSYGQIKDSIFSNSTIPSISIFDYLVRIEKYTKLESSSLILALIYIDRIYDKNDFELNEFNIHKLLFTSIIVAMKYNEDRIYDMKCYSKVGGISIKTLTKLEYTFLELIDYDLFVEKEEYKNYCNYFRNN